MPKVKVPRKSTFVDMTAMTDVAFLLLTFFMLATKFKPEEPVVIDIPKSTSKTVAPEKNYMMVTIDTGGRVFYGIGNEGEREILLEEMGNKYGITFTSNEIKQFATLPSVGVPMAKMKEFLNLSSEQRAEFKQTGIPLDSANNELKAWVSNTRRINNELDVIVKGDRAMKYVKYKEVMKTLKPYNFPRYNFVTALESGD